MVLCGFSFFIMPELTAKAPRKAPPGFADGRRHFSLPFPFVSLSCLVSVFNTVKLGAALLA